MMGTGRETRPWDSQVYAHHRDGAILANHAWLGSPRGGRRKLQGTQPQLADVVFPKNASTGSLVGFTPRSFPNENEDGIGAGVKSGYDASLAQRRTYEKKSVMGSVMLGQDVMCPSQSNMFSRIDNEYAGLKTRLKNLQKPFRQPGLSQNSVMDTVVYGRDFDFSGPSPTSDHFERYWDHAGERSLNRMGKPFRKPSCSQATVMDTMIYGRDIDGSGENPHAEYTKKLAADKRAGLQSYSKNRMDFPCHRFDVQHKPGLHVYSVIDHVVFGKDKDTHHAENFINPNDEYAGVHSGAKIVKRAFVHAADPDVDFNCEVTMPMSARETSSRLRRCDTEPALPQERMGTPRTSQQGSLQGSQTPPCRRREVPVDQLSSSTPQKTFARPAGGSLTINPKMRNPFGGPARGTPGATPRGSVSAPSVCSSARGGQPQNLTVAFDDGLSVSSRGSFKPPPRWR